MASMPFDANSYNSYLASLNGKPMVQVPPHHQTVPPSKPAMLPFSQFPPNFVSHQVPFSAPPINVAPWSGVGQWAVTSQAIPPVPPPFPASFQAMRQPGPVTVTSHQTQPQVLASTNAGPTAKTLSPLLSAQSPTFLPSATNPGQWPPLPNFVPSNSPSNGSVKIKSVQTLSQNQQNSSAALLLSGLTPNNRAVSCPPPPVLSLSPPGSGQPSKCKTILQNPVRHEPFKQLCHQLRLLLDKMVPLNFDSTASRIRKILTTDRQALHDTDQFCEAVRIIVEHAVTTADHQDAFNMYINLFRSLSKVEFVSDDDAKPVNFLNTVINSCFTLLHIRGSYNSTESENKYEKEDDKESQSSQLLPQSSAKMLGSIRLVAGLFKAKEITKGQIVDCVNRLIRLDGENAIACIHELLRLIGRDFDESVKTHKDKQTWWANLFETLKFIERRSVATPKIRAYIQEIMDARENNWNFQESNDDEAFKEEVKAILDGLPHCADTSATELFVIASKRLRHLIPTAERRPYLFTEMIDALLAKCHFYHSEVLGVGKTVVDTEKMARMQIENEVMTKQKQNFAETLKTKDKTISTLEEKNKQLEAEIGKLTKEILCKEETIEQQMLNEASYRSSIQSNFQQAFDAKVDEFRKQLAIQLQAYIGNQ